MNLKISEILSLCLSLTHNFSSFCVSLSFFPLLLPLLELSGSIKFVNSSKFLTHGDCGSGILSNATLDAENGTIVLSIK